jgi:probable phosphoglycerate mutase
MVRFALLRHAETDWNRDRRIQGVTDTHLTGAGEEQARAWGQRLAGLDFDGIICSDLARARRSAELINETLGLPVSEDARLREQHWGEWTGLRLADLRRDRPDLVDKLEAAGWGFRPPGGEDRLEVLQRAGEALRDAAAARPGRTVLIVTHEGVIKCLVYHLAGRKFLPSEPRLLDSGALHWLSAADGALKIAGLNALQPPGGRTPALEV